MGVIECIFLKSTKQIYITNYLHYVIILFSSKNEEILFFIYSRQQGSVVFPLLRNEEN